VSVPRPPLVHDADWLARAFGRAASDYGKAALRFLPFLADRLVYRLRPARGEKCLDLRTGIGTVGLALARLLQPGGRVSGIDLAEGMLEAAEEQARRSGLTNADWHGPGDPAACQALLESAGIGGVTVETLQVGYHLGGAGDGWDVVWTSDLRALVERLPPESQGLVRVEHLQEVERLRGPDGIWMDATATLALGRKRAG
jgi:SAM-dependent methyltransferase